MSRRAIFLVVVLGVGLGWLLVPDEPESWPVRNAPAGPGPVVCFGDSLTRGQGADAGKDYPSLLGERLDREVVNAGRNGETSVSALERLEEDVLSLDPAVVVVTLGGNDILRRIPVEETVQAMEGTFRRTTRAGAVVAFLSIDPPFVSYERMEAIRDVAREHGVLWVDRVMEDLWGDRSLMADRIHPNAGGYRRVAERVATAVRPHL